MDTNASTFEKIIAQAQSLSPLEKARLAEWLSASIRHEFEVQSIGDKAARIREWRAVVARTAGALADDPIERPPQGSYEQRDPIQ